MCSIQGGQRFFIKLLSGLCDDTDSSDNFSCDIRNISPSILFAVYDHQEMYYGQFHQLSDQLKFVN